MRIASFSEAGELTLLPGEYNSYADAVNAIKAQEPGTYQVQKVFVVS